VARQRFPSRGSSSTASSPPQSEFQVQLQSLLKQQKYRQALDEIKKAQRSQPGLEFKPSEAEIWLLRGKQEFEKVDAKQAESSLRRSLELGLNGETHYWLAKCLLTLNRLDAAIALLRGAFEQETLPKDYSVCYAKLLLLKGDTATVETLLRKQAKRFPAAQQHWLRGVLALQAKEPATALEAFKKVKRPLTPGDRPDIWQIYTQQQLHNWDASGIQLGMGLRTSSMWGVIAQPTYTKHPLLQRLALLQHIETQQPPLEQMPFRVDHQFSTELIDVLSVLELIDEKNLHEAAHSLLKVERRTASKFPELATLRPALLTLAGDQSLQEGEVSCAAEFWQLLHREQPAFNPHLAVNLMKVLDANGDYNDLQRLLTQLIKWLEKDFKANPESWPEQRRKTALAYAHCRQADTWMALGRSRAAMGELQTAERLYPQSPEVVGRHGLLAAMEKRYDEATRLLTQALEEGARYGELYMVLVDSWKKMGKPDAALEARRRFGKKFGDLSPETDVEVLPWIDALSTRSYPLFSRLVETASNPDAAMQACRIFVDAVQGKPTASGKISLNQSQAVKQWDALLQGLSPKDQVLPIQAIALALLLFAKREKGIAALISDYMVKLVPLEAEYPAAKEAHMVILALRDRDPKKLEMPLQFKLATTPQPGNTLAQIQLQVRRYAQNAKQSMTLRPFLEDALRREPQNPLLLLAKATTYPAESPQYEDFKQQGFELARRLQDAKALQAFREEQALLDTQAVQDFLPDPAAFDNLDAGDMDQFLEAMIRKMVGGKIPPADLKRMLPELKQMMLNDMPDFEEEDDDDSGFGFPFGPLGGFAPPTGKPSKGKGRSRNFGF